VSFVSNGTAYLSTTTDANGYFRLKGDYEIQVSGAEAYESSLNIEYNGQNEGGFGSVELMRYPPDVFYDTLYRYNTTLSVLIVELDNPSFGNQFDTLLIDYRPDPKEGKHVYLKFAGPFYNGDILDTILTPTTSHVGYGNGITSVGGPCNFRLNTHINPNAKIYYPQYPWVTGQPNNACGNYTNVYLKLD
jgi:hypothetical protein